MKKLLFLKYRSVKVEKKKVKKVKKSTLRNKADALFSKFIRRGGVCQAAERTHIKCGGPLQCAHLTTRSHTALRFDEMNALCLCAGHHRYFTHRPFEWMVFLTDNYPQMYAYVTHNMNKTVKKTEDLYREVIEHYTV